MARVDTLWNRTMNNAAEDWFASATLSDLSEDVHAQIFHQLPDVESKLHYCNTLKGAESSNPKYCRDYKALYDQEFEWMKGKDIHFWSHEYLGKMIIQSIPTLQTRDEKLMRQFVLLQKARRYDFSFFVSLLQDLNDVYRQNPDHEWLKNNDFFNAIRLKVIETVVEYDDRSAPDLIPRIYDLAKDAIISNDQKKSLLILIGETVKSQPLFLKNDYRPYNRIPAYSWHADRILLIFMKGIVQKEENPEQLFLDMVRSIV